MEKEIVKTLMSNGKIVMREKVSLTSNLPFITKEENCLSNILNVEENEKLFKVIKNVDNKRIENIVNSIAKNDIIFRQIINGMNKNNDLENILESLIKTYNYGKVQKKLIEVLNLIEKDRENQTYFVVYFNKKYIENEIHNLKMVIENGLYSKEKPNTIEKIVDMLKRVKTKEDLYFIMSYIKGLETNEMHLRRLKDFYNYNSNLVLSIMTKEILKSYVEMQISKINKDNKEVIEQDLNNGKDLYEILTGLDNNYDKVKTNNGIIELTLRIFNDELEQKLEEKSGMLCWSCSNGYVDKCSKIKDLKKKSIEEYPFIISGYQVIKNEEIEKFFITDCKKYRKASNNNQMSKEELRQAKAKLAALFYGTETLEEGLEMQEKKKIMHI